MLALMILTRRRLWIHHGYHIVSFTILSSEVVGTHTDIIVDAIHTSSSVLTYVILTIVYVVCTIYSVEAWHAFARVVSEVVLTFGPISTWIEFRTAELNFRITIFT